MWRRHRLGLSPAPFACSTKELHSCNSLHMNAHHHTNADNPSSKPTADEMPDRIATSGNPLSNSAGTSATNPLDSEPPPGSSPNCSSYSGNHVLPSSVPLLYGLSEQVVTRPGYWPNSVHCCGFWQQEGVCKVTLKLSRALSSLELPHLFLCLRLVCLSLLSSFAKPVAAPPQFV